MNSQPMPRGSTVLFWLAVSILVVLIAIVACLTSSCGRADHDHEKCTLYGENCQNQASPTPVPGPAGSDGSPGTQGPKGATGPAGQPGVDGVGCSVEDTVGGAIVTCGETQVVILDGAKGDTGDAGADAPPTPYTITGVVDPCGKQTTYDEVLFRTADGNLIAHFSNGSEQFLTLVPPGNYITSDGTGCYFTVNADGSISGEHN